LRVLGANRSHQRRTYFSPGPFTHVRVVLPGTADLAVLHERRAILGSYIALTYALTYG